MLTLKENLLLLINGQMPEYVPRYRLMWGVRPPIFGGDRRPDGSGTDVFGVEFVNVPGTGPIQRPGFMLFDDITKWRDYVKTPDFSGVDWAAMAKPVVDGWDPNLPRSIGTTMGFFQAMYNFMGMTNALLACAEEPEEVKALMDYLTDFYIANLKEVIVHYKPDYITMGDDIAHARAPFVSLPMYRELFKPYWKRYIDAAKDAGLPVVLHDCGNNDILVDDFVELGINAWEPAEESNHILDIKARHDKKIAIMGAFRQNGVASYPDSTEEDVRAEVRRVIETYAPGGGYAFCGIVIGAADDAVVNQRNEWIADEYQKFANDADFYKNNPTHSKAS
ncbi:MAG: hypothetical protein LBH09_03620 [Peptococcaceae bacterium]|jgi:hypothetical protein|nr:hypothetical protein [Peptococcaceae bacterium]